MPKNLIKKIIMPPKKPDRCFDCPLIGIVPPWYPREDKSRKGFVCLGANVGLTSKGIKVDASTKDSKHPWHRPCDNDWDIWYNANPRHEFGIGNLAYISCRLPFQQYYQQQTQLIIKFH